MTVTVRHRCARRSLAEALRRAVIADNPSYVAVTTEGTELVVRVTARSAASARTTLDDLMACLSAAERAVAPSSSS